MELSERKKKILSALIEVYIATAEPVGSKTLAEGGVLDLSSATIRNEMSELTALGYLEQPHTSAGRIPSPSGYRLYVNELMERQRLSAEETEAINSSLRVKMEQLDKMMTDIGSIAASLTHYPALALAAPARVTALRFDLIYVDVNTFIIVILLEGGKVHNKLIRLPFSMEPGQITRLAAVFNSSFTGLSHEAIDASLIDSAEKACGDTMGLVSVVAAFTLESLKEEALGRVSVSGVSQLLRLPEYSSPGKAHNLMSFLADSRQLLELPSGVGGGDVEVIIGPENVAEELKDSSVVIARYDAGDNMRGIIGVVGPTRMDYSLIAAKLSYIASGLSKLLGTAEAPPGFGKLQIKGEINDEH